MTCIIYVDGVLVADRAGLTDDFVAERSKIHHREKMVWGSAGVLNCKEAMDAQCLHDLVVAYERHARYLKTQRQCAIVIDHNQCAWQIYIEEHPYVQPVESGTSIGSYRNEWMNYRSKHGVSVKSAIAFCKIVSAMHGLGPVANALPSSALRPNASITAMIEGLAPL